MDILMIDLFFSIESKLSSFHLISHRKRQLSLVGKLRFGISYFMCNDVVSLKIKNQMSMTSFLLSTW